MLEYAIGNVAVAISWGDYFTSLLRVTCALYIGSMRDKPGEIGEEKAPANGRHKGIPPLIDAVA